METLLNRVKLRHQRLKEATAEGKALIAKCSDGGVAEGDFHLCKCKLKQNLEAFEKDLFRYLDKDEARNIDEMTQDQIQAEETLTEMEATSSMSKRVATVKLPEMNLPSYDGDRLKWNEFWDRFKANVHQQNLADADKMSYLLGYLKGAALDTVSGLTITDTNYVIAIETLEKRFGSKDIIIDAHYTAINNLNKAMYNGESCRSTLDSIERHMRVLEELGEPVNGNHLRAMILSKFPDKVIHEHHLIGGDDGSMAGIRKSLQRIVTAMEKSSALLPLLPSTSSTTEALQIRTEARPRSGIKRKQVGHADVPLAKRTKRQCLFCSNRNHVSSDCRKFSTVEARQKKLEGRCLLCLKRNHTTSVCKRKISCFRCKGNHLRILCPKPILSGEPLEVFSEIESLCATSNRCTFLQTAVATLQNPQTNQIKQGRILLDSGSQRSYITQEAANKLDLPILKKDSLLIFTFGATEPQKMSSPSTKVNVQSKRGITNQLYVNIVPKITDRVPVASFKYKEVDVLADDDTVGETVDLLIGNDYYSAILRENKIKIASSLYLLDTDFGWVLSGNVAPEVCDVLSVVTYCQCHIPSCPYFTEPDLPLRTIDMKFLWSLESIGITDSPKATRQEEAVRHFNDTVQYEDGRYMVKWPWIQYPPDLHSNFGLALGRLKSVLRRLDSGSLQEYDAILMEQLELGIIEIVTQETVKDDGHPLHYLPHHMVKQKGKKGRIVYDASAKISGQKSLNECLYSGPSMLEDMTALILQFRTKRYGILADVEKAFLQVALQKEDRDVTRFLWLKDVKKEANDDNLLCLRFCRVPFGVISSPFLLTATIRHHISQSNEALLKSVADKCYVDNLVTGANSEKEAEQIFSQTRATFGQLSMNIRDWVSNNHRFMDMIPESHKMEHCDNVKVLGLNWNVRDDQLSLNLTESHFSTDPPVNTKRKVLRALARVYDPCGFACPLMLSMKLIFQHICVKRVKWDAELPMDLVLSIKKMIESLKTIASIKVPRYIGSDASKNDLKYQLHCFTDASKDAYAAVIYLKVIDHKQNSVSFLMAKSHVSQAKDKDDLKIPKLELLGFLIGSRLLKYVRNNLELEIDKEYLWSDSLVVLSWMRSTKLLPPFVANRVNEIKQNHPNTEMCYIHTKSNPADIATRPELFEEKRHLWYNGPDFLVNDECSWPENRLYEAHQNLLSFGEVLGDSPGELGQPIPIDVSEGQSDPLELTNNPSDSKQDEPMEALGSSNPVDYREYPTNEPMELDSSDNQVQQAGNQEDTSMGKTVLEIKELQKKYFPEELDGKRTHLARNLDLFVDVDGVLRCRGRMANTNWSYDMKYPILLPRNCEFTDKLIQDAHESNYHVGAPHTLNIIRERYWIPRGKTQVQKIVRKCLQCIKHGGGPYRLPATPALPPERVNYNTPYTYTGVDYLGPLFVSTPTGREKRWIALFTCLTVRAIHLEIVKDLSAEECLLALRRFAATRGNIPKRMYSDNATCFKLVSEVVQQPYCIENEIQWKFIPQLAPWHGGFYERLVAMVKHCLKRTLETHLLNDNRLLTVIKEVEAVLNTRPLTRVGTDVEHILRPADFLSLGKCLTTRPSAMEAPADSTATKGDLIESWKRGLKILGEFKRMFINQYLASLRERYRHAPKQPRVKSHRTPQVGDLVQIKSDLKNRNQWKVGKIDELIEGRDGQCRVARVKVDDSTLQRSIGHLYPLEVDDEPPETEPISGDLAEVTEITEPDDANSQAFNDEIEVEVNSPVDCVASGHSEVPPLKEQREEMKEERSKRVAAIRARDKILEWTRQLLVLLQ